jgi:hypothetical protein
MKSINRGLIKSLRDRVQLRTRLRRFWSMRGHLYPILLSLRLKRWALRQPLAIPDALITMANGLYAFCDGHFKLLESGFFFGLARLDDIWVVATREGGQSGKVEHLLRFTFDPVAQEVHGWQEIFSGPSGGIHQIDFLGDRLYVARTYRNEIAVFSPDFSLEQRLYPRGPLADGRKSPNYAHLNSVFANSESRICVLAHNESQKTGKPSEIMVFDDGDLENQVDTISPMGTCAHNIVRHDDVFLVCDSLGGKLLNHGQPVLTLGTFVRGLGLNDDVMLLGGSVYSERGKRISQDVFVYLIDREFHLQEMFFLKDGGQVNEIRLLGIDYGLSNTHLLREQS